MIYTIELSDTEDEALQYLTNQQKNKIFRAGIVSGGEDADGVLLKLIQSSLKETIDILQKEKDTILLRVFNDAPDSLTKLDILASATKEK